MLLDLIQPSNQNTYNIKLAHAIGLHQAIYCGELLNILGQVVKKNKFDKDGFFRLNRAYMEARTTFSIEDQLDIESSLSKINLINKDLIDQDLIKIDLDILVNIITNTDTKLEGDLKKKTRLRSSKEGKEAKRIAIMNNLKNNIVCSNSELLDALRNWVDGVFAKPNGYLSKSLIQTFQNTLNQYTRGDLDLALAVVNIAAVQGFRDCSQAISWYERGQAMNAQTQKNKIRVTNQVVSNNLSSEVF